MEREVERIYRTLLTRITRRPKKTRLGELPILIGCPDSPVQKREARGRPPSQVPNAAVHYHFVLAVPSRSRLREPLDQHVQRNIDYYKGKIVLEIHVTPVTDVEGRLADYVLKQLKRKTYTADDILVLPQHNSELPLRRSS